MKRSPNRLVAVIVGAVFLAIGLLGVTVTSGLGLFATESGLLFGVFGVNLLLVIAHVLIGAALAMAGLSGTAGAKMVNVVVGVVCLLLGIVGLVFGSAVAGLATTGANTWLHFASAVVLLVAGLAADKGSRRSLVQPTI